ADSIRGHDTSPPARNRSRALRLISRRRPSLTEGSWPVRIMCLTSSRLTPSASATSCTPNASLGSPGPRSLVVVTAHLPRACRRSTAARWPADRWCRSRLLLPRPAGSAGRGIGSRHLDAMPRPGLWFAPVREPARRSRRILTPRLDDDGGVLVVRPQFGEPRGELAPLGPARSAGGALGVPGRHADRGTGGALPAAGPARAAWGA